MIRVGRLLDKVTCPLCRNVYLADRSEVRQIEIRNEDYDPEDPDDREFYYRAEFHCPECDKDVYRLCTDVAVGAEIYTDSQLQWFRENNKQYDNKLELLYYDTTN